MSGLWGDQIRNCLKSVPEFCGVFARDTYSVRPGAAVINTARSGEAGEHWVCLLVGDRGGAFYFDSYGRPPFPELARATRGLDVSFNPIKFQTSNLPACGHYCVYLVRNAGNIDRALEAFKLQDEVIMSLVGTCGSRSGQTCRGASCTTNVVGKHIW